MNIKNLMRVACCVFLIGLAMPAAAQYVTATVTVTNVPVDGDTFVPNSSTRTFKNTVTTPASQIQIGADANTTATNLFQQLSIATPAGIVVTFTSTNSITIQGTNVTVTKTGTALNVVLVTNTVTPLAAFMLPAASVPSQAVATNQASQAVTAIDQYSTNAFSQTNAAMAGYISKTNAQTLGNKTITNSTFSGGTNLATVISNSPAISGTIAAVTNGSWYGGYATNFSAASLTLENTANLATTSFAILSFGADPGGIFNSVPFRMMYLSPFSSFPGIYFDEGPGGQQVSYIGPVATSSLSTTYISVNGGIMTNAGISGLLNASTNLAVIGGKLVYNGALVILGGASFAGTVTNVTAGGTNTLGGVIAYAGTNNSSLANGNNAGVIIGTNSYVNVSGPSAGFTICGIVPAGIDRQEITIENETTQSMTIANQSGVDSTAANRIKTGLSADLVITNIPGEVTLVYRTATSRWTVKSHN